MRLLSHPFRLGGDGQVVTVEQDSDQSNAEQIAMLVLTHLGERPLAPDFGITDPTFGEVDASEIAAAITENGPDIDLGAISTEWESETTQLVRIEFE